MLALAVLALPTFAMHKVWTYEFPWPNAIASIGTVIPAGDRLFFVEANFGDGGPFGCLDARTGAVLWRRDGADERAVTLILEGDRLVLRTNDEIREVSAADGHVVWTTKVERGSLGPFVVGDRLVAETAKGRLEGFDLRTHRPVWRLVYPSEFAGYDRNAMACVADGALWAGAADGKVVKVNLADGRLRLARPFDGGDAGQIVPMRGAVALCGTKGTAAWRTSNGATLWRRPDLDAGKGFYVAERDELWQFTNEGESLTRLKASDGRTAGPAKTLGRGHGYVEQPARYGRGYMIPDYEAILGLDAEGRPTGRFPTLYTPYGLLGLGKDLVVWQGGTIYRLTPGASPPPLDAVARAEGIVAKPDLGDRDIRALWDLGRAAVPALAAAVPGAAKRRRGSLLFALTQVADARDTGTMLELAQRIGTFTPKGERISADVGWWLQTKGDPDRVARTLLPRPCAATDEAEARRWIRFMNRSTDPAVVDELFRRLRSSATPDETKGMIYPNIAASERPDVLDWILRTRAQGRRLARPISGLSATRDTDGDGIPDAYDANPYFAPRVLSERERILVAAFDAFARFDGRDQPMMDVGYGPGARPFELLGWAGGLRPLKADAKRKPGEVPWGLSFETFSSDGETARFEPGGREATVRVARRYGYGTEERLRNIRGEWFVVSLRVTWQN